MTSWGVDLALFQRSGEKVLLRDGFRNAVNMTDDGHLNGDLTKV